MTCVRLAALPPPSQPRPCNYITHTHPCAGRTRMQLRDYLAYSRQQHDEEPLYIFDA